MTKTTHTELLQQLRAITGKDHVLTDGDLSAWELDWRKREPWPWCARLPHQK